jgi:hypothetical protein
VPFGAWKSSMKSAAKLYKFHQRNLEAIQYSLDTTGRLLRSAISANVEKDIYSFTRLYTFLLAAWAECRLNKLQYEDKGFSSSEREFVQAGSTQLEKWSRAIETAFRNHYNVRRGTLSKKHLPHSAYARFVTLNEMLDSDLRPIIELRNKLAHGQWVYPLNNDGDDISADLYNALRRENLLSLQFKRRIIHHMTDIIHDLVVSKSTFERDFDDHFEKLLGSKRNLETRSYTDYVAKQRVKFERGKLKRNKQGSNN